MSVLSPGYAENLVAETFHSKMSHLTKKRDILVMDERRPGIRVLTRED